MIDKLTDVRRIEKEKNQMKTEIEDLRAQIDQLSKAKVPISCTLTYLLTYFLNVHLFGRLNL